MSFTGWAGVLGFLCSFLCTHSCHSPPMQPHPSARGGMYHSSAQGAIKLHTAQLTDITAVTAAAANSTHTASTQHGFASGQNKAGSQRPFCGSKFIQSLFSQTGSPRSADKLLLYLGSCGEGGLAEGEGITARLQLALARVREVRVD